MAEAAEHNEHAGGHGAHAEGPINPAEHIKDKVLFGVDASSGKIVKPYDAHGHLLQEFAAYTPAKVGPFKLEFTKHMASITVAAALIFVAGMATAKRVMAGLHDNKAPKGRLANAFESVVMFVRDEMVEPMGGHHLGHYTPLFITYFMLILTCNIMGMVPDFFGVWGTATGNFSVTLALGGSVYALIWILGLKNQGFGYITHLVPPGTPLLLWPLMFGLELLGPVIKCFVLCVRLFANMIAGHLIVGNILNLGIIGSGVPIGTSIMMLGIGVPLCLGLSFLELMVCVIQAYVFTLLSVIFIGGAVHPEH
jgi:F-type H+-transporting ATPase subunit a